MNLCPAIPFSLGNFICRSGKMFSNLQLNNNGWRFPKPLISLYYRDMQICNSLVESLWWPVKIRNEELWQRGYQEPVGRQILRRKWGWIGHALRKEASNITRQSLTWNPQGKRRRGRPKNSWRRDTDTELRMMGYTWKEVVRKAQIRVRWRAVVNALCSNWGDAPK